MIVLDADLQDPPAVALELAAKWREGWDVVNAIRDVREGETWFKRVTGSWFYRGFNRIWEVKVPLDWRLPSRRPARARRFRAACARATDSSAACSAGSGSVRRECSTGVRSGWRVRRSIRCGRCCVAPTRARQLLSPAPLRFALRYRVPGLAVRIRTGGLEFVRQAHRPLRGSGLDSIVSSSRSWAVCS